jgi:hypothetical protein
LITISKIINLAKPHLISKSISIPIYSDSAF